MEQQLLDEKITKKNSILYNQLWINKAIEEGNIDFLPSHKIKDKSIGEYIEIRYNQELSKATGNGKYLMEDTPKINKKNSLLFTKEWILKANEEGMRIPNRTPSNYSIGEVLELKYYEKEIMTIKPEEILYLPSEKHQRKKLRK